MSGNISAEHRSAEPVAPDALKTVPCDAVALLQQGDSSCKPGAVEHEEHKEKLYTMKPDFLHDVIGEVPLVMAPLNDHIQKHAHFCAEHDDHHDIGEHAQWAAISCSSIFAAVIFSMKTCSVQR